MTTAINANFTVDGYRFSKSIEAAEAVILDIQRSIREARCYQNLPYENGCLGQQDVSKIVMDSGLLQDESAVDRLHILLGLWNRLCEAAGFAVVKGEQNEGDEGNDSRVIDIHHLLRAIRIVRGQGVYALSINVDECLGCLEKHLTRTLRVAYEE